MVAEHGCGDSRERIAERIDEQIVETAMSLEAVLAYAAASKNSWAQVITDREVSLKTLAEELMVLASVTRVLQLETEAEGQMCSLFRQSSSIGSGTLTPPARSEVMALVRRVAEKEHSRSTHLKHFRDHEAWCWD